MALGTLEYLVIGFDHPKFDGTIVNEIQRVIDAGIVRLVDAVVVRKDVAGNASIVEVDNKQDPHFQTFAPLLRDAIVLFTPDDLELFAQGVPKDSSALVLLFEHRWVERIEAAMVEAGGFLLSRAMIDPETVAALSAELGERVPVAVPAA